MAALSQEESSSLVASRKTEPLPFVPALPDLPDGSPPPFTALPLTSASLAPRRKDWLPNRRRSSSKRINSLLGMMSLDMVSQHATDTPLLAPMKEPGSEKVDQQPPVSPETYEEDLLRSVERSLAITEADCLDDAFDSPRTESQSPKSGDSGIPFPPSTASSRLELRLTPCDTPQGETSESYRLARRDHSGPSQRGRHCLLLPQL